MKNKFIIHIGPHKTGSTYMQKVFFNNRKKLLKNNLLYPEQGIGPQWGHHKIADKFNTNEFDEAAEYMSKIKETQNNILISSENFDKLQFKSLYKLREYLKGYEVEIFFVKRSLNKLLISNWQESIKHGGVDTWEQYVMMHLLRPFVSSILNANKVLDIYSEVFGINSIKIIDFDNVRLNKVDICDVFFGAIGKKNLIGIGTGEHINNSMSYVDIEKIRILNVLYLENTKQNPHHNVREKYVQFKQKNKKNLLLCELDTRINNFMEEVNFSNTLVFNALNNNFKDKYMNNIVNDTFQEYNKTTSFLLPNPNWILEKDSLKLMNELYKTIIH